MHIDILTLFPGMFTGPFSESVIKRAIEHNLLNISVYNIRDYTSDKHHIVDDYPYGGGAGMVLKPEPVFEAVESVLHLEYHHEDTINHGIPSVPVILLTPQGRLFNQKIAEEMSINGHMVLICGHYEGVDERVREHLATDEISIGDYVLTGGELAAMVVVDTIVRLIPGVLGSELSIEEDSHTMGLLEYPHYTRPSIYRGWSVPDILTSGNHGKILKWRREQAILRTLGRRPDMLKEAELTMSEKDIIEKAGGYNKQN